MLSKADKLDCMMISTSLDPTHSDMLDEHQVVAGHCYSLLSVHEIQHNGCSVRLVKMRNTWSRYEWDGAWSDNSQEWKDASDDLKEELKWQNKDDGIFFMPLGDYLKYFEQTTITLEKDESKYHHNRVLCDFNDKNYQCYSFELEHAIDLTKESFGFFFSQ